MRGFGKPKKKASFYERLEGTKSVFKEAYVDASLLKEEIQSHIKTKEEQIAALESEIKVTKSV